MALETSSTSESLRLACADVFESWIAGRAERHVDAGLDQGRARELAIGLLAALEGAFVLSRALRSTEPFEIAGQLVAGAVAAELERPSGDQT